MTTRNITEICAICGCILQRCGEYAKPTIKGRTHATKHHYVAERFFGRSKNRPGTQHEKIFNKCPWNIEGETGLFCYECHEELLHNPVFLPEDIQRLSELVKLRGLSEDYKTEKREIIAQRIQLLQEVISKGLQKVLESSREESGSR